METFFFRQKAKCVRQQPECVGHQQWQPFLYPPSSGCGTRHIIFCFDMIEKVLLFLSLLFLCVGGAKLLLLKEYIAYSVLVLAFT